MLYGCQGSYIEIACQEHLPKLVTFKSERDQTEFRASALPLSGSVLVFISEAYATGQYTLSYLEVRLDITIIPRFVDWCELPTLPIEFTSPLCEWANSLQYSNAAGYDSVVGLDFVKTLPTDWGDHLLSLDVGFDEKILDIGTGTGRMRLSAMKRGYRNVIGLDSSEDCLRRQRNWQDLLQIPYIAGQLTTRIDLEEHAGSFSVIALSSALHHIADIEDFLLFCSRLLRPNGIFIASAEPANKKKFHAACGHSMIIDLAEVCELRRQNARQCTRSTTLVAEFWDGVGFTNSDLRAKFRKAGLVITNWDVFQWTASLIYAHARNYLPLDADEETRERFHKAYLKAIEVDNEIKSLVPEFARDNFFNVIMIARKGLEEEVLE